MNILEAVILGIAQGLAEFLPISSSGHLVLLQTIFGIDEPAMQFDVLLHLATLIPVFIVFRREIFALIRKPFQRYTLLLVIATIPAVIAALLFGDAIDELFATGRLLSVGFILTGCILLLSDRLSKRAAKAEGKGDEDISIADAAIIGTMQAVAICPGISRSGSTISASLFRGLSREAAARFSFLLSIPAILGATVLQVKDLLETGLSPDIDFLSYGFGFIAALLAGWLSISFMLGIIKKSKLGYFSVYVFLLAGFILLDQFVLRIWF